MALMEPKLSVNFELIGLQLDKVQAYSLDSSFTTSTDGFSFTVYDHEAPTRLANLELQPVTLSIDGVPQLIGRIDVSEIGGDGTAITYQGRDYLADLVECHVDPTVKLKKGMLLMDAMAYACAPAGIDQMLTDANAMVRDALSGVSVGGAQSGEEFSGAMLEEYRTNEGEGMFAFCQRLAARHGGTVQPGLAREQLVICAPNYIQSPLYQGRRLRDQDKSIHNNILTSSARRDFSKFPTYVLLTGKQGRAQKSRTPMSAVIEMDLDLGPIGDGTPLVLDGRKKPTEGPQDAQKLYRFFYRRDPDSKNAGELSKAAARAFAERYRPTLEYQCTLRGHSDPDTGAIYTVDTIIAIQDTVCNVNENLWIESRTLEYSADSGPTTTLKCIRPNSYLL